MSGPPPRRGGHEAIPPATASAEPATAAPDRPAVAATDHPPAARGDARHLLPDAHPPAALPEGEAPRRPEAHVSVAPPPEGQAPPPGSEGPEPAVLLEGDALPLLPEERWPSAPLAPRRLWRSFGAAFLGLGHLLRHEPNAQIHAALAVIATALGLWLRLTPPEWALLMALFGLVIGLEAMNTAVEGLADLAMPRQDPRVATIKDVAAGGVLIAALAAAAAGLFLFGPRLLRLLGG